MQRYVRMFGTPVRLLAFVVILVMGAKWGMRNVVAPVPPAPLTPCTTQSVGPDLNTTEVTVQVLNGGTTPGLAGTVAGQLRVAGFKVGKTGNTETPVTTTQVIGATADSPEVKLVAGFFKGAKIVADGRADHSVLVMVGNKETGFERTAPVQISVSGGVVCLPAPSPIATPSA